MWTWTYDRIVRAWDEGLEWHLEQTPAQAPDLASYDPLSLAFVRDQHLRAINEAYEDEYIQHLIRVSYFDAERVTRRSLIPQSRTLVLNQYPSFAVVFPNPNLLSVESIDYVDGDGATQQLSGSPEDFLTFAPSGPKAKRGYITPLVSGSWPSIQSRGDAVRVTFESGYPIVDGVAAIPDDITHGRLLVIGELYKQRSESVHAFNQNPAVIRARDFWVKYRVY